MDLFVWSRRQPWCKPFHYCAGGQSHSAWDARQGEGGEGGGGRCEQGRTDSFPEKMSLELADKRSLRESGFNERLKAERGFQPFKKRSGEGV